MGINWLIKRTHKNEAVSGHAEDDDAEVEDEEGVERGRVEAGLALDAGLEVVDEVLG
jgi:hypothetical protein